MSKGIFSALCAAVCALSGAASAQDEAAQETGAVEASSATATPTASADAPAGSAISPGKLRILGGLHFGGGGDVHVDPDGIGSGADYALTPLVGLQAGADYVIMKYFAIGGELRATFWNAATLKDLDVGRSTFVDINVKPRGGYTFDFPLEVYGTIPMGLTIAALNDDSGWDGGAGFNLGFGAGANYFFTEHWGVNSEMLGVFHWFKSEIQGQFASFDASMRTGQFYLFINGVYAL